MDDSVSQFDDYYTYVLNRPAKPDISPDIINPDGTVTFYIGKGRKNRINHHEGCARRNEICRHIPCRVIRKVWREGQQITKEKIEEHLTEPEAHEIEKALIAYGRSAGWPLVNLTDGGEGTTGYKHTKESHRVKTYPGFTSPDGLIYESVRNLSKFCAEHGIQRSGMCLVAQGKQPSHLGWTLYPPIEQPPKFYSSCPGFMSPDSTIYTNIPHLSAFCEEHGLSQTAMSNLASGKRKSHQGWTCYPPPERTTYTTSGFVSPDGTVYTDIPNLRKFCLEHGLGYSEMAHVNTGKLLSYKDWAKYPPPENIPSYSFVSPDGIVHTTKHISDLCREHGLSQGNMSEVHAGRRASHKGWTKYVPDRPIQPSLI